jgi:hypothetical protein
LWEKNHTSSAENLGMGAIAPPLEAKLSTKAINETDIMEINQRLRNSAGRHSDG